MFIFKLLETNIKTKNHHFRDEKYEQFFDLKTDPWETRNLVTNEKYANDLAEYKSALKKWENETEISKPVLSIGRPIEE